jgi:hypothetical protein
VLVCVLLVGFGIYTVWRGIGAASQGVLVPGGPRFGSMSGSTAIIVGACSVLAGLFGLWLTTRGSRRKR